DSLGGNLADPVIRIRRDQLSDSAFDLHALQRHLRLDTDGGDVVRTRFSLEPDYRDITVRDGIARHAVAADVDGDDRAATKEARRDVQVNVVLVIDGDRRACRDRGD